MLMSKPDVMNIATPIAAETHTRPGPMRFRQRAATVISSAAAAVLGVLPHVLHHAGPLAGAALLAGTSGTLLFGASGLGAAIPSLLRVHRRSGNWRVPAALLATFALMFSISAFLIGPAITGDGTAARKSTPTEQTTPDGPRPTGHDAHH